MEKLPAQAVGNDYEQEKMPIWERWSMRGSNLKMERLYIKQAGRLSGRTHSTASSLVLCESAIVSRLTTIPAYCPRWAALLLHKLQETQHGPMCFSMIMDQHK